MRRLKLLRIERVSPDVRLVLQDWAGILFAIGIGLLLIGTLHSQLARAEAPASPEFSSVSPRVPLDRDLFIAWRPLVGSSPAVAALTEARGDTTHARRIAASNAGFTRSRGSTQSASASRSTLASISSASSERERGARVRSRAT